MMSLNDKLLALMIAVSVPFLCLSSCEPNLDDDSLVFETDAAAQSDVPPRRCEFYQHPTRDVCVQCLEDQHCLSGHCEPGSFQCVSCYDDSHCPAGVCLRGQFFCVECSQDSHCGSGTCDLDIQQCVGCGADSDCDDSNVCTEAACVEGTCEYTVLEGQACDVDPCFDEQCSSEAKCISTLVATIGACEKACDSSAACGPDEWCRPAEGCSGEGVCMTIDASCAEAGVNPVCGCDSKNYKSACVAEAAGVAVAYPGQCECVGDGCCSGVECCESPPVCEAGELLDLDNDGCVDICCATPPVCPGGVPVDTNGDGCAETCPCSTGEDCGAGTVCKTTACGTAGLCAVCSTMDDEALMCTCEGQQVSLTSACAQGSGVVVGPETDCCPAPPICPDGAGIDTTNDGCIDSCSCLVTGCVGTDVCASTSCGSSLHVCAPCLVDTGAVCGCDGVTYSNQCLALQAGTSVLYGGPCECSKVAPCVGANQVCDAVGCTGNAEGHCVELKTSTTTICGCDGVSYEGLISLKASNTSFAYSGCCTLKCAAGLYPVDTDGDGCDDVCKPGCASAADCGGDVCVKAGCELIGNCAAIDTLLDGCAGLCACPGKTLTEGCELDALLSTVIIDSSGDACAEKCAEVLCTDGKTPTDSDQDGCPDLCKCPPPSSECNVNEVASQSPQDCSVTCLGATCSDNTDCVGEWYCEFASCSDGTGTCVSKESSCDADSGTVCGCNGVKYANACAAKVAGVSLASSDGPQPCVITPSMP